MKGRLEVKNNILLDWVTNTLKAHKRSYSNNINMTTSKSEKNTDLSESSYFDKKSSSELSPSGTTTKSVERRLNSVEDRLEKGLESKIIELQNRLTAVEARLGIKPTA